jgi:hypothetical protein
MAGQLRRTIFIVTTCMVVVCAFLVGEQLYRVHLPPRFSSTVPRPTSPYARVSARSVPEPVLDKTAVVSG